MAAAEEHTKNATDYESTTVRRYLVASVHYLGSIVSDAAALHTLQINRPGARDLPYYFPSPLKDCSRLIAFMSCYHAIQLHAALIQEL